MLTDVALSFLDAAYLLGLFLVVRWLWRLTPAERRRHWDDSRRDPY